MKIEIIKGKSRDRSKFTGLEKQIIDLDGNTIFPYYIDVLSIQVNQDTISIRMTGDYETRVSPNYDEKKGKPNDKLWITGREKIPGPEDEARIM